MHHLGRSSRPVCCSACDCGPVGLEVWCGRVMPYIAVGWQAGCCSVTAIALAAGSVLLSASGMRHTSLLEDSRCKQRLEPGTQLHAAAACHHCRATSQRAGACQHIWMGLVLVARHTSQPVSGITCVRPLPPPPLCHHPTSHALVQPLLSTRLTQLSGMPTLLSS